MRSICSGWEFTEHFGEEFLSGAGEYERVRLPHTVKELPLHYAESKDYEMVCGYRRVLSELKTVTGKRVFVQFDAAAHIAEVYFNGVQLAEHRCGYTAFRVELTDFIEPEEENLLVVKLDCTENPSIPPFGHVVDYLTYGGLYREVWLDFRENSVIEDVFVSTPSVSCVRAEVTADGEYERVRLRVFDGGKELGCCTGGRVQSMEVPGVQPWSTETPKLYTLCAELLDERGGVLDTVSVSFGFRTAEFRADGFYLNGKKTFLRGLNRHQSYPIIGYAATEHLQREDARILRHELGCNAVRTSHYPQSHHFLDACDREGLLVFTEIPGWQHIGGAEWKEQAIENVREMVVQYRNHPSIVLWGVRINESGDDDGFYRRTNALAHALDPTRATSGVRCFPQSSLLEDVYAYNDFSHYGVNGGVWNKKKVTPDMEKALLVSEHNGHMYPVKASDETAQREAQALRHARVLSDAAKEHAGCFGWCMFDYATHKDFGSGDRICYHGVMDAFRNPKSAAYLYASQSEETPILEVSSTMDPGDYPAGNQPGVYVFTNADAVKLYKNEDYVATFLPRGFEGLAHGPILVDDFVGKLLEKYEGMSRKKAQALCALITRIRGCGGPASMPLSLKLETLAVMKYCGLNLEKMTELYGKYVSSWGDDAVCWRFEAIRCAKAAQSVTRSANTKLHLEVRASQTTLREGDVYDMAAVRIRILDENGACAGYAQLPVHLKLTGALSLVGEDTVTAEGGMCGCYLRTKGRRGRAVLTVSTAQTEPVTVEFEVVK